MLTFDFYQAGGGGGGGGFPLATFLGKVEPKVHASFDSLAALLPVFYTATQNVTDGPEY